MQIRLSKMQFRHIFNIVNVDHIDVKLGVIRIDEVARDSHSVVDVVMPVYVVAVDSLDQIRIGNSSEHARASRVSDCFGSMFLDKQEFELKEAILIPTFGKFYVNSCRRDRAKLLQYCCTNATSSVKIFQESLGTF